MKKPLTIIAIVLSLAALPGCQSAQAVKPEDVVVGKTIPDFSLQSLDGKKVDKSSLKGEVVVLNFWASWCAPCMGEIPDLEQVAATNAKAHIVGIALDEDGIKTVRPFVESHGINYTVLLGDQDIFQQFNGVGIPYTLILDRSQRIFKIYRGPVNRETLEADLKALGKGA